MLGVQEVALVDVQLIVEVSPGFIVEGVAVTETVGKRVGVGGGTHGPAVLLQVRT
jgi:hypothetical protein